jgi:hypothetical protein
MRGYGKTPALLIEQSLINLIGFPQYEETLKKPAYEYIGSSKPN